MLSRLLENWPYKLAAVIIAIALRSYVAAQLNPHPSKTIAIHFSGVPSNLVVLSSSVGSVRVDLSGSSSDLDTLRDSDITADVDLSNARSGKTPPMPIAIELNHDLPPDVRSDIKLDGPTPATVVVILEPLITQTRKVHPHFDRIAPAGSMYGVVQLVPSTVEVQARQDIIDKIGVVTADIVTPDEVPGTAQTTITGDFDVVARGVDGHALDGVIVNPAQVHVTVPMLKAESTKIVSIDTAIVGSPAANGHVASVSVTPSQVTISGTPDVLAKVGSVMTRPVDVSGASGTQSRTVELIIPPGLTRVGTDAITVDVTIAPATGATATPTVNGAPVSHKPK